MLNSSTLKFQVLHLALILFCLPIVFPSIELSFIIIQFGFLFPLYIALCSIATSAYALFLMCMYLFLLLMVPFGMPGSIIGWMAMLCAGYFFGVSLIKEHLITLKSLKVFFYLTILSCLWIVLQNYRNGFNQAQLSDYFQTSSINTVPLLAVCSVNLYCGIYYYTGYIARNRDEMIVNKYKLLFSLFIVAILTVLSFGFRSGSLLFILLPLVLWHNIRFYGKFIRYIFYIIILGFGFLVAEYIYELMIKFFLPGRDSVVSLAGDLAEDTLRVDRIKEFWSISSQSKLKFDVWSSYFSVSAMSDFTASLFPISLLFFIPAFSLLKLIRYFNSSKCLPAIIIILSAFSSLLISILQPDFYSMFTFFAITTIVFIGEKRRAPLKHQLKAMT